MKESFILQPNNKTATTQQQIRQIGGIRQAKSRLGRLDYHYKIRQGTRLSFSSTCYRRFIIETGYGYLYICVKGPGNGHGRSGVIIHHI